MKFSVIIPLYNKAKHIAKAIASVQNQTFSDLELIVVNDGSTDSSKEVAINALAGKAAFLLNQDNAGVSTARNNGVRASHGDYICFLDADDWWEPDFLDNMNQLIDEFPEAGIYGCGYFLVKHGNKRQAPIGLDTGFSKGYINYCEVYSKTLCMPLSSISVAIPRTVFEEMGGFKPWLSLGEDFDLWIRIALSHKVAFLDKPLANYNQDVETSSRGVGILHDPSKHMLWNLDYLAETEESNPRLKKLIDRLRVYGLMPYYLSGKYREDAKNQLRKVIWSNVDSSWRRKYSTPVAILKFERTIRKIGSNIKQRMI